MSGGTLSGPALAGLTSLRQVSAAGRSSIAFFTLMECARSNSLRASPSRRSSDAAMPAPRWSLGFFGSASRAAAGLSCGARDHDIVSCWSRLRGALANLSNPDHL